MLYMEKKKKNGFVPFVNFTIKMLLVNPPMNIPTTFGFNWLSGFGEED